jgi:hypothetical protein
MAALADKLFVEYGVAALGFGVLLAESDQSSGLQVLERLGQAELKRNQQYLATVRQLRPQGGQGKGNACRNLRTNRSRWATVCTNLERARVMASGVTLLSKTGMVSCRLYHR